MCRELRTFPARLLLAVLAIFAAVSAFGDIERCAICGHEILDKVYFLTDKVTEEKKHICGACADLPNDCYLCSLPVKEGYVSLPDGRFLCARDARTAVIDENAARTLAAETMEAVERMFSRFLSFPEASIDVDVVDRVNLRELFKFPGNDYTCPNVLGYIQPVTNHAEIRYKMSLLSALPRAELKAVIAHEYSHAWVFHNVPARRQKALGHDAHEGFCELIAYLLMDAQQESEQKKMILRNHYTRGQIDLFIEAEKRFGLNEIVDWMKYGTDSLLSKEDANRVRNVEMQTSAQGIVKSPNFYPRAQAATGVTDTRELRLKGIQWWQGRALALINNRTMAVGEEFRFRTGETNEEVRCVFIGKDSVKVLFVKSGKEQQLFLEHR